MKPRVEVELGRFFPVDFVELRKDALSERDDLFGKGLGGAVHLFLTAGRTEGLTSKSLHQREDIFEREVEHVLKLQLTPVLGEVSL